MILLKRRLNFLYIKLLKQKRSCAILFKTVKIFKIQCILSLITLPLACAFADLNVSAVFIENGIYKVSFNGSINVHGISLKNSDSGTEIVFPFYKGKNGAYAQFSILKRDYKKRFAADIKGRKNSTASPTKFVINKFSIAKNLKSTKAFASVIFEDVLEVECRVLSGKNGLWIAWPAVKQNGAWHKQFEFTDKTLAREVESRLLARYNIEYENSKNK